MLNAGCCKRTEPKVASKGKAQYAYSPGQSEATLWVNVWQEHRALQGQKLLSNSYMESSSVTKGTLASTFSTKYIHRTHVNIMLAKEPLLMTLCFFISPQFFLRNRRKMGIFDWFLPQ
ncbi:MAG: hypothetical protein ACI3YL_00720, partial [Prevotella sp.]